MNNFNYDLIKLQLYQLENDFNAKMYKLKKEMSVKEQKKIPEKLEYYDDSIAWVIDDVGQLSDVDKVIIDKVNEIIDYLKSKGE